MPKFVTNENVGEPPVHVKDRHRNKCSDFIKAVTSENKASVPTEGQTFTRKSDPITSKMAAEDAKPNVGKLDQKILDKLNTRHSGLTSVEASILLNEPIQCVSTRFAPLRRKGLIIDSGFQRKNPSGSWAIVWLINGTEEQNSSRTFCLDSSFHVDLRKAPEKSKPSQEQDLINQVSDVIADIEDIRFKFGPQLCYASREGIRNLIRNLEQDKHNAAAIMKKDDNPDDTVVHLA